MSGANRRQMFTKQSSFRRSLQAPHKALLNEGATYIKKAIVAETSGEFETALKHYEEGIRIYLSAAKVCSADNVKQILMDKLRNEYLPRAESLKAIITKTQSSRTPDSSLVSTIPRADVCDSKPEEAVKELDSSLVSTEKIPDPDDTDSDDDVPVPLGQVNKRQQQHNANNSVLKKDISTSFEHKDSPNRIHWLKGEKLGKGSFGAVYTAMDKSSGTIYAVKQVSLSGATKEELPIEIHREIEAMQELSHPHIVDLVQVQRNEKTLDILMEYVPGKSLDKVLEQFGALKEEVIRNYTYQMLSGLKYCHENGVLHRDIKGQNILVDIKGQIRISDFGSAKSVIEANQPQQPSVTYAYTALWCAPEVMKEHYTSKVDIWSVGCVVIEMATAQPPWSEKQFDNAYAAMYHIGNTDELPRIPSHLSEECQNFIRLCLERDPDKRPSADKLLHHVWLSNRPIED